MKRFKMKAYLLVTLLLGTFILQGCGDAGNGHWDKPPDAVGLVSIAVTPATASIPMDGFQQFTATATYADGSSRVVTNSSAWTSDTPGAATVAPTTGVAEGVTAGTPIVITATLGGQSATAVLTVRNATLTSVVVTPALASTAVNGSRQFTATANYSDATTLNVTTAPGTVWTTANVPVGGAAVATLSANGVVGAGRATGKVVGTADITATYRTLSDTSTLTVTAAVVTIIPGAVCSVDAGPTIPTATLSNPTSGNLLVPTSTAGVANNGKLITATFSLAMDPATIASALPGAVKTFTIKRTTNGVNVAGTVAMDSTNQVATFTTSAALLPNTDYTVTITTAATSAAVPPNPIACPYEWNFRTVTPATVGIGPVNLGRAASFGIAAVAGVENTGATQIDGDVVLNTNDQCNAVTVDNAGGFGLCGGTPPTISGEVITPTYPDLTTAQNVTNDLRAAYLSITPANMPGATAIAAGTTLGAPIGNALVEGDNLFFPGVYQSITSILITGDLTLDAQGDPDAVFVFQSSSTIGTDPNSRILLVGSAKASNVWWQASSAATVQTNSAWQGNILASGDVTMVTGATSCGRVFAGATTGTGGAFVFDSNRVSVPGNPNAPVDCK